MLDYSFPYDIYLLEIFILGEFLQDLGAFIK